MDRRHFLQASLYSSLLYGAGGFPGLVNEACAGFEPVQNRLLVNLFLNGGPDIRHLIVPAFDSQQNSFGYKYWQHRWRAHDIGNNPNAWQQRWEDDYYPITVGGQNWSNGLVDTNSINSGVTFGIWKHAGWLIDMFRAGNVALVCNAAGGRNRAHDLASLQMHQGILDTNINTSNRSGWGGRLARSAGGNSIAVTNSPLPFTFGPAGSTNNYNINAIDNRDLISVQNSREFGLNEANYNENQFNRPHDKMARALKHYYEGLRNEQISTAYEKFRDHEQKVRLFGNLIRQRLSDLSTPQLIEALMRGVGNINLGSDGNPRRVLRSGYGFGSQIRNLYDVLAANDLLGVRTVSMEYGGWDTHGDQRQGANNPDINDPNVERAIESRFKDIFGGKFGNSPSDSSALHAGFSALWASLNPIDREKIVITVAGEFGRQIRDNADRGTDHGEGNIMFVIGDEVNGGLYGDLFQDIEIDKFDDTSLNTPDIDAKTDIDPLFARVCDWVEPNSGDNVFPRTAAGYSGDAPEIEMAGMFNNLFTS